MASLPPLDTPFLPIVVVLLLRLSTMFQSLNKILSRVAHNMFVYVVSRDPAVPGRDGLARWELVVVVCC